MERQSTSGAATSDARQLGGGDALMSVSADFSAARLSGDAAAAWVSATAVVVADDDAVGILAT